jgi:hypothetical protein
MCESRARATGRCDCGVCLALSQWSPCRALAKMCYSIRRMCRPALLEDRFTLTAALKRSIRNGSITEMI